MDAMDNIDKVLEGLSVEPRYFVLVAELSGGSPDYLSDISVEDLHGREDAESTIVTLPVARGLVRKLAEAKKSAPKTSKSCEPLSKAPEPPALMLSASEEAARMAEGCSVSLLGASRDSPLGADGAALLRCCVRAQLPEGGAGRRKVLAIVLDQSGSMAGAMWRRVVEAVVGVVTDDLLQNTRISIAFVVYADQAREVRLPRHASELRELLLSPAYAPRGGTSFQAAFHLAQQTVERELARQTAAGVSRKDVDIATLLFTDGEDTSVKGRPGRHGIPLVDKDASRRAARAAGDAFREALRLTGCSAYTCIAAFGADHDPDQCQYLSDRYYYINRGEVLAEVLAGGLGALLRSAGQCSLRVRTPLGVKLEEPLPETLPLDDAGRLDHHIWLRLDVGVAAPQGGRIVVDLEVGGTVVTQGTADVASAAAAPEGSFDGHLLLADLVALQLRRIARELSGAGASISPERLGELRARLTDAKTRLQATKQLAGDAKGSLRGRAALRERVAEVEAARERLSYALGQFDEGDVNDQRTIGAVAIDAILRDAGQHVPQGPVAAALVRRADAAAALPPPEPLSTYGRDFSTDAYSCCDARELALQGDALFFQLSGVRPAPGGGFLAVGDRDGLVSHEAFVLLSADGRQAIKQHGSDEGFTHCGIPLYATPGHFLRARMILPEVLQRLTSTGVYKEGESERQFLSLLGRSLARPCNTERQIEALLHKARAVHVLLASTTSPGTETTLLRVVVNEAAAFVQNHEKRAEAKDLFAVAAAGVLADDWDDERRSRLAVAIATEALRRRFAHALRGADEAQRLCLAWALLGPADADANWMDEALPRSDVGELSLASGAGFNPFNAPKDLEDLERISPGDSRPRAAGAAALLSVLSAKQQDNDPSPQAWGTMRRHLEAFGRAVDQVGGFSGLMGCVDSVMTDDSLGHTQRFQQCVTTIREAPIAGASIRAAFPDPADFMSVAISACVPSMQPGESLRLSVAAALRAVIERRRALVCKYPIVGKAYPRLEEHTGETVAEVWGAPAHPTDLALHHKAMLRVWRRTMRVRITTTTKEALADKEYRKRGGSFVFPSPMDTFIRGLHRRTQDLHNDWRSRLNKDTSGDAVRSEAVAEMLLRLRWDDSDAGARAKLSQLVARIWDDLEGVDLTGKSPLSSALWLHDAGDAVQGCERRVPAADGVDGAADASRELRGKPAKAVAQAPAAPAADEVAEPEPAPEALPEAKMPEAAVAKAAAPEAAQAPESAAVPPGREAAHARRGQRARDYDRRESSRAQDGERREFSMVMDEGLQAALDTIEPEVRRRMDNFAADKHPGSRMKLPLSLRAKQRKAVHVWAEGQGLMHKSFGYRGRRRLHLTVAGAAEAGAAVGGDQEFDWNAWGSDHDSDQD